MSEDGKNILKNAYDRAVIRAGGLPMIVPVGLEEDVEQLVEMLDGLLLSGGNDINPMLFNEEPHTRLGEVSPSRDSFELELARQMLVIGKPILGICRGIQVLNVVVGGTLYQDLYQQNEGRFFNIYKTHPIPMLPILFNWRRGAYLKLQVVNAFK